MKREWILAITGASGAPIGLRLFELLSAAPDVALTLIVSENARIVLKTESGINIDRGEESVKKAFAPLAKGSSFEAADAGDFCAPQSSGTHPNAGMIIAPCSMSTLSAVACGITLNLIHRAASVMLKEKRPLILVPRETPLSPIHLKNMLELSRCGAHVVPACVGFYYKPDKIQDMVDSICLKTLDLAGIRHELPPRWHGLADAS